MEFQISKKELLKGLTHIQPSGKSRNLSPIAQFLKLEALASSKLALSMSDLEIFSRIEMNANVLREGSCLLPARRLFDLLRHLPEGTIQVKLEQNLYVSIHCKSCHMRLAGSPSEDFPSFPEEQEAKAHLTLPLTHLSDLLRSVLFCVNENDTRSALTGILVQTLPSKKDPNLKYIRTVSSDGHRLALSQIPLDSQALDSFPEEGVLLPKRACQEILRLAQIQESDSPNSTLEFYPGLMRMRTERFQFLSRYIEASFPPYNALLERPSATTRVRIPKAILIESLKRFQTFSSPLYSDISFQFMADSLILRSRNPELGEMTEEIALGDNPGKPLLIYFNVRSMLECLLASQGQEVWMSLWGEDEPAILRSSSSKEYNEFLVLIMPMQGPNA